MPRREWRHRVEDMLLAVERIERYTAGVDRKAFLSNDEKIDAVVRNIEVIGEAAARLPEAVKEAMPHIPWRQIRGMRNLVVHMYWGTEAAEVWKTIQNDLPTLREALQTVLKQPPDSENTTS